MKNAIFFAFFAEKWEGCSHNIETFHKEKSGTHFAKFLISNYLKGVTYGALWAIVVTLRLFWKLRAVWATWLFGMI